ncbi:arylsulfatase [Paenarthrobacter ureafaciens]|uniref:arylsulfatase n=1 Tax=Paenarthrobacter TaxID=1742992 RepID=UPI00074D4243|nr:arylsulfatase [Paenarthrobacter ureafaciens]AMB42181.1 arylsulfatase [Arthrobacter sp. ATCC 21022]BCW86266.1 sulfatase [Arthrobacter sp. NicSoilE8]KUR65158.1 arylsulfatase [Arthrobacter sp. ATCC 21022]NWL25596.1 arylsulfatase [Paenarthrobacter ureafaciens]RWW94869.1 arylsulfatase [Paenarthrobacter ureafaciens]
MKDISTSQPNVLVILADDLGYSDLGSYGGEIDTPNLDQLAEGGARLTQFYTTARCSPSRASLLTGMHPHQTGIGVLTGDDSPVGYEGNLNRNCPTAAEIFSANGYATAITGKWHLAADVRNPNDAWPTRRGFDYFYGTLTGCGSFYSPGTLTRNETNIEHEAEDPDFYYTNAITEEALGFLNRASTENKPFFLYVAYTAPHWPLHAPEDDIRKYDGRFDAGWDKLRQQRFERQYELGIVEPGSVLSPRDPEEAAWVETPDHAWQTRRMQTYAAQVDRMDQGIGKIITELKANNQFDNTIIIFLSDNGASPEEIPHFERETFVQRSDIYRPHTRDGEPVALGNEPAIVPGPENTYASYGRAWANLSNTPFRMYKKWTHEGGIAAPFIIHWPAGAVQQGRLVRQPLQLTNVLPTLLEAAGIQPPTEMNGTPMPPLEGTSFLKHLTGDDGNYPVRHAADAQSGTLYWEHAGNGAIRRGDWKLVRNFPGPWELYNLGKDATELDDVLTENRDLAESLLADWAQWADRVGVLPFERIVDLYELRGRPAIEAAG